ncbi:MAG: ABC transporter ATP-binding protein [Sporichthyaceae bacterium]
MTAVGEPLVKLRGLRKTFRADTAPVRALRGLDLDVADGEFLAIMGPSGCGKSTLLNVIAGLEPPDEGTVEICGESLDGRPDPWLARFRCRNVGLVFQFFNLIDDVAALDNLLLPAALAGRQRRDAERQARETLALLGLGDRGRDVPAVMSGGERQRLAIARALINRPRLLLADEPTGALDSAGGAEILDLFRRLHGTGQTIVMVTHSREVAAGATRIVHMRDGVLVS